MKEGSCADNNRQSKVNRVDIVYFSFVLVIVVVIKGIVARPMVLLPADSMQRTNKGILIKTIAFEAGFLYFLCV